MALIEETIAAGKAHITSAEAAGTIPPPPPSEKKRRRGRPRKRTFVIPESWSAYPEDFRTLLLLSNPEDREWMGLAYEAMTPAEREKQELWLEWMVAFKQRLTKLDFTAWRAQRSASAIRERRLFVRDCDFVLANRGHAHLSESGFLVGDLPNAVGTRVDC